MSGHKWASSQENLFYANVNNKCAELRLCIHTCDLCSRYLFSTIIQLFKSLFLLICEAVKLRLWLSFEFNLAAKSKDSFFVDKAQMIVMLLGC